MNCSFAAAAAAAAADIPSTKQAAQMLGVEAAPRQVTQTGGSVLVPGRLSPAYFPFTEWPLVLHVQQLITFLTNASENKTQVWVRCLFVMADVCGTWQNAEVSHQSDSLLSEANKASPNIDWIANELATLLSATKTLRKVQPTACRRFICAPLLTLCLCTGSDARGQVQAGSRVADRQRQDAVARDCIPRCWSKGEFLVFVVT